MAGRVPRDRPSTEESVHETVLDIVHDLKRRERVVEQDLPETYETAGIDEHLRRPIRQWTEGEKPIRTVPAAHVWESLRGEPLPEQVEELLTGLDVAVTAMDDIVDMRNPSRAERISLTAIVAFSGLLSFSNIPESTRTDITDELTQYLLEVAQIPTVEQETLQTLDTVPTREAELEAARFCYEYRARDIDAFARVPALVFGVDADPVLHDLRTFRAHELLYEDVVDVELDLRDERDSPLLRLIRTHEDAASVVDRFEALYDSFTYSTQSHDSYRDRLIELEGRPIELDARIEAAVELVSSQ